MSWLNHELLMLSYFLRGNVNYTLSGKQSIRVKWLGCQDKNDRKDNVPDIAY